MSVGIFFCYAHEDEALLNKLKTQLRPLQRQGLIAMWHDRDISAGTEWKQEIKKHLNEAKIILLLVSPDFLDSDYCYSIEMQQALARHQLGEVRVIPIILRPVHWQGVIGNLQALPTDAKPIVDQYWFTLDQALYDVVEGIRTVVEQLEEVHQAEQARLAEQVRLAEVERVGQTEEERRQGNLSEAQTDVQIYIDRGIQSPFQGQASKTAGEEQAAQAIKRSPISNTVGVIAELRRTIGQGIYQPGLRLKESELAEEFQTSRAAVREALQNLQSKGLVQHIPHRGFFIPILTLVDAEDIFQLCEGLEGAASKLFTQRATSDQFIALKEAVGHFETVAQERDSLLQAENLFYEVLLEGCGNQVIRDSLLALLDRSAWLRGQVLSLPGRSKCTIEELYAILVAIMNRDAEGAEIASKKHVREVAKCAYYELRALRLKHIN